MMVGSGTTTVWCVVTFVPNLLLLVFTDHRRTHTKEKPFLCDVDGCGYATAQKGHLTRESSGCGYSCCYLWWVSCLEGYGSC